MTDMTLTPAQLTNTPCLTDQNAAGRHLSAHFGQAAAEEGAAETVMAAKAEALADQGARPRRRRRPALRCHPECSEPRVTCSSSCRC
eukprot:COSAG01_NODE_5017_length_4524_cov_3.064836_3_plen_87_part_00